MNYFVLFLIIICLSSESYQAPLESELEEPRVDLESEEVESEMKIVAVKVQPEEYEEPVSWSIVPEDLSVQPDWQQQMVARHNSDCWQPKEISLGCLWLWCLMKTLHQRCDDRHLQIGCSYTQRTAPVMSWKRWLRHLSTIQTDQKKPFMMRLMSFTFLMDCFLKFYDKNDLIYWCICDCISVFLIKTIKY